MAALEFLTAVGQICSDVRQVGLVSLRKRFLSKPSREVAVLDIVDKYIRLRTVPGHSEWPLMGRTVRQDSLWTTNIVFCAGITKL